MLFLGKRRHFVFKHFEGAQQFFARLLRINHLVDVATVSREVSATGEYGEQVRRWDVVAASVPCRVIKTTFDRTQTVSEVMSRETAPELYSVILPVDAVEVQPKDRITVGGRVFRVVQVQPDLTDAVFQRVQAVARD